MSDYEEEVLNLILEDEEEELVVSLPIIISLVFCKFFGYREEMFFLKKMGFILSLWASMDKLLANLHNLFLGGIPQKARLCCQYLANM